MNLAQSCFSAHLQNKSLSLYMSDAPYQWAVKHCIFRDIFYIWSFMPSEVLSSGKVDATSRASLGIFDSTMPKQPLCVDGMQKPKCRQCALHGNVDDWAARWCWRYVHYLRVSEVAKWKILLMADSVDVHFFVKREGKPRAQLARTRTSLSVMA